MNVLEKPLELGRREIGIDHQSGARLHFRGEPLFLEPLAQGSAASTLPDNGVIHRLSRGALPEQRGLSLISEANGGDLVPSDPAVAQDPLCHCPLREPNIHGIVFNPTRLRIYLRDFLTGSRARVPFAIEQNSAGTRRPLVEGKNVCCLVHGSGCSAAGRPIPAEALMGNYAIARHVSIRQLWQAGCYCNQLPGLHPQNSRSLFSLLSRVGCTREAYRTYRAAL